MDFWCRYQHRSGGFDEYWPKEDSYPPLVFSFFAILESYRALNFRDKETVKHLEKAYIRLLQQEELGASNQEAAAIAALYGYYLYKNKPIILKEFNRRLGNLLARQSKEGWFPEHGGADIGYSSVTLYYLAYLYKLTKREEILDSINGLLTFLSYFIHPDGSCGGEYGSRNTEYFLMGGLTPLFKENKKAQEIFIKLDKSLDKFDDRYLFHYIFHSYIYAFLNLKDAVAIKRKVSLNKKNFWEYFKESGLYVKKHTDLYFIANLKKGGTFKIFYKQKLKMNDCGYRIKEKANIYKVSSWINYQTKIVFKKKSIKIESLFFKNKFFTPSFSKHFILRFLSLILGNKMVFLLKKTLVFQDEKTNDSFIRVFQFTKDKILIKDVIKMSKELPFFRIYEGAMRVVPSANFFSASSLRLPLSKKLREKRRTFVKMIKINQLG